MTEANYKITKIKELLSKCTEKQNAIFKRMYGKVDDLPEHRLDWAITQCENTIAQNKKEME